MNRHNAHVMSPEYEGLTEVFIADQAQAVIDELVDMLENMVFNSNLHHNDAVELLHKYKWE